MEILLLEDDALLGETLVEFLESQGFYVTLAKNGLEALDLFKARDFSIYLLDIKVSGISGLDFLDKIRSSGDTKPAIFITSIQDKETLLKGFKRGCDDFIRKPFDLDELLARIKAILQRCNYALEDEIVVCSKVILNMQTHQLRLLDKTIRLSPQESLLLKLLATNKNRVVLKDEIYEALWAGKEQDGTLRVYISRLKAIFGDEAIENIRGIGYIFKCKGKE